MYTFLSKNIDNNKTELVIDSSLFTDAIAMKAAYAFLDRAYFFFRKGENGLVVQISPKAGSKWDGEMFALEYSDELLATHLRVMVEIENKEIRETIVRRALGSYADLPNFNTAKAPEGGIDFDKDINEILKEIENDPELKIDEDEINRILAEIEAETKELKKPKLDPNKLKDVKKNFQHR